MMENPQAKAQWNTALYLYVSSATPDDPQFNARGGLITISVIEQRKGEAKPLKGSNSMLPQLFPNFYLLLQSPQGTIIPIRGLTVLQYDGPSLFPVQLQFHLGYGSGSSTTTHTIDLDF
ncbi:hypothetical protein ONZ45_g15773 [Pleurotus djamor]|nr:hypothetical protein ONZ45_g15773 [Pleurotus djamor]